MRIFVFFYRPQTIILTITIILMITHKFNANKKAHPPKVQKLSEDGLLLSRICFLRLERVKIPLKSNKKRRLGTNNCILFCVLIWWSNIFNIRTESCNVGNFFGCHNCNWFIFKGGRNDDFNQATCLIQNFWKDILNIHLPRATVWSLSAVSL